MMFKAKLFQPADWCMEDDDEIGVQMELSPELAELIIPIMELELSQRLNAKNYEAVAILGTGINQLSHAIADAQDALYEQEVKVVEGALMELTEDGNESGDDEYIVEFNDDWGHSTPSNTLVVCSNLTSAIDRASAYYLEHVEEHPNMKVWIMNDRTPIWDARTEIGGESDGEE